VIVALVSHCALIPAATSLMVELHVLTRDAEASQRAVNAPVGAIRHENTYTCPCDDCKRERAFLVDAAAHRRKAA
jgi:hypothetical protein